MNKAKAIRWTINQAALEFAVGTKTVSSALKAASISPGKDGKFSTVQIAEALFDSEHVQRVRLIKEQADAKRYENAETERTLVPVELFSKRLIVPLKAMKQRILEDDNLSQENRRDLLLDLQDLYRSVFGDEVNRPGAKAAMNAVKKGEQ